VKRLLAPFVFALFVITSPAMADAAQPNPALSSLDAELLIKVRLANLWEMPAGEMAIERSASPQVQEVGRTMMTDHAQLDVEVQRLAGLYNLRLPPEPNDMQKSWLTEMARASGSQFDSVWAMRLRAAHGLIFPVIASSRAATTDPEIRKFATTANTIVLKHMTILESTGAVDSAALYDPTPLVLTSDSDGTDMVVALTLVPLVAAIAIFLLWLAAGRNKRRTEGPRRSHKPEDDDRRRNGGTKFVADRQRAR
jgi:predicted outer membrane protein